MSECPTQERMEQLLGQEPHEAEVNALMAHIDECENCQTTLRGISDEQDSRLSFAGYVAPDRGLDGLEPACFPTIAGYKILAEIGRGGMGIVYQARQAEPNRIVAVKMIHPRKAGQPESIRRFVSETKALANLNSPGIVPIYEVGEHAGQPFFTMAFIDGPNLADWLKQRQSTPMNPTEVVTLMLQIVDAVSAAHRADYVHRDLKPENILIDQRGKVFVTDFGMAAAERDINSGRHSGLAGTPDYMAPEQLSDQGHRIGERTDVFALGVILYELLAQRLPWPFDWNHHKDLTPQIEAYRQVVNEKLPKSPCTYNSEVTPELESVCLKALSVVPAERFKNCMDFSDALRRAIGLPPWIDGMNPTFASALAKIRPGPMIDLEAIEPAFLIHLAEAVPSRIDAIATVNFASEMLLQIDPTATTVKRIHLPTDNESVLQLWGKIFYEACTQGPRMLTALLLSLPTNRLPPKAIESVCRLLGMLESQNSPYRYSEPPKGN